MVEPPKAQPLTDKFKYGMPIYSIAWPPGDTFYLCGGGGSTSSGIKNRVVSATCKNGKLSDQTGEYLFGKNCPMRMVVSPDGKFLVVAVSKGGIRVLRISKDPNVNPSARNSISFTEIEVDQSPFHVPSPASTLAAVTASTVKSNSSSLLRSITSPAATLSPLASQSLSPSQVLLPPPIPPKMHEVTSLAFHPSGHHMAFGCEDGSLIILNWPSLTVLMKLSGPSALPSEIKDLDFHPAPQNPSAVPFDSPYWS
eukprot:CAMPEP_0175053750 /NCGR_PEP_ID=MMETSP0052_2-20121109/9104_1 /TAXON_ID=51329 ORGANISM="Polytomella parva, Strain SAG 63-3" /NCGR_SAMPLE_ID=MMETSP0052_2 /ASSEMBLY_ACC=CAM_ASM_000194 /LENGTH=253 /DNA_ID=CAMNT_0016318331 /DNA_START=31 /DNA_END=791 /DNA_ORIENTATION=-